MKTFITNTLILLSSALTLFALRESIGRIGDLELAKNRPELFEPDSFHIHYANNPVIMYIHVVAGMIFLITGVYQLIPKIRNANLRLHRIVGQVFLIFSFLVSLSAIYIALFLPYGNWLETLSNLVFGTYILYSTVQAYTTAKEKKIVQHSEWVKRVFFVSLSIATIRLIMMTNMMITNESAQQVMGRSFLIGFLLHIMLVEWWITKIQSK